MFVLSFTDHVQWDILGLLGAWNNGKSEQWIGTKENLNLGELSRMCKKIITSRWLDESHIFRKAVNLAKLTLQALIFVKTKT